MLPCRFAARRLQGLSTAEFEELVNKKNSPPKSKSARLHHRKVQRSFTEKQFQDARTTNIVVLS